ncbi:MAG: hypothetical protein AAF380_00725 [Bacteroidota bacterium]
MKTTFKLLHLLSYLLLCTPNTPFASTPNPRRNLKNGSNFCYATSALQAYADYLDYIFSSNQYPYQAPINENDPPKLKDQKKAYQEVCKALDYINKKSDIHPNLHTLLTLINKYIPDLNYQKGRYNNSWYFITFLCYFFDITEDLNTCFRKVITPLPPCIKPPLKVNTNFDACENIILNHYITDPQEGHITSSHLTFLLTYLYAEALQSAYPNNLAIPLVPESCITSLYESIVTYLLDNELKSGAGQSEKIVANLAIYKALDEFIAANLTISITASMKTQMHEKMIKELKKYIEKVDIHAELYTEYTKFLKALRKRNMITDNVNKAIKVFLKFYKHKEILQVKHLKLNIKEVSYSENELNEYFKICRSYPTNHGAKIEDTIAVEDMQGRIFRYALDSGLFSIPKYSGHYIAFVKHPNGYRIYDSLNYDKTADLHDFGSLTQFIVQEVYANPAIRRYRERLHLVYKKAKQSKQVQANAEQTPTPKQNEQATNSPPKSETRSSDKTAKDNQIQHNAHTGQVTTPKQNEQATNSPPNTQSKFLPQASPILFGAGAIGLASFAVLASKKYSKPQKMQASKNKKSPHSTKY